MVLNNNYEGNKLNVWTPEGILSVTLISSAFVMSIFFGIKLRWFRYRMKFPSVEESPVILRANSMTDIRQSCSTGRYSHFEDNSTTVSITNYSPTTPPPPTTSVSSSTSSSSNVKSKKKEQESIFKWPFRSKLNLKKTHSFDMNRESHQATSPQRREQDFETMQKNERIKRSIYERLNSSASMPDLLHREEHVTVERGVDVIKPERIIAERSVDVEEKPELRVQIHKGIEVTDESTQFVTVDEIKLPKRPIRGKVRKTPEIPVQPVKNNSDEEAVIEVEMNQEDVEEIVDETIIKPPTPPHRRQSRSNSLRASQIEFLSQLPPLVMPRKNINQSFVSIESVDEILVSEEQQHQAQQLKSILKTGQEEVHKVQRITFVNVPDSPSETSEDERENEEDVWSKIDTHRNQLKRYQEYQESSAEIEDSPPPLPKTPPPLPKTPPPTGEEPNYLRDFTIA